MLIITGSKISTDNLKSTHLRFARYDLFVGFTKVEYNNINTYATEATVEDQLNHITEGYWIPIKAYDEPEKNALYQ